jgi:hypothetical protein
MARRTARLCTWWSYRLLDYEAAKQAEERGQRELPASGEDGDVTVGRAQKFRGMPLVS